MTKMEMVNRMIILGCIKETDRNHWMRHTKDYIMKIYIEVVPMRLEYLKRGQNSGKEEKDTDNRNNQRS